MPNHKITFTLKQHTPLIHFQHDQPGATLRATELKPKLDRFLIEKEKMLDDDGKVKEEYKKLFIANANDHLALDYKMKIFADGLKVEPIEFHELKSDGTTKYNNNNEPIMAALPTFFANMGDSWHESPKKIVHASSIKIKFFTPNEKIYKLILQYFSHFIHITNFGMRQSKGFGSFTVIDCSDKDFKLYKQNPLKYDEVYYSFTVNLKDKSFNGIYPPKVLNPSPYFKTYGKFFEILNIFSKTYRSGINQGGYYFKSLMYSYAKEKMNGATWDKKYFKQQFLGNEQEKIIEQRERHNYPEILDFSNIDENNTWLLRDLLGLSNFQYWKSYNHVIEFGTEENTVKRFQSPVVFKPVSLDDKFPPQKFEVYIIINPIPSEMFNQTFNVAWKREQRGAFITDNSTEITTPNSFSLPDFFSFCFTKNIDKHVLIDAGEEKSQNILNHRLHKALQNVYSQLSKQIRDHQ